MPKNLNRPPWSTRRAQVAALLTSGVPIHEVAHRLGLSVITARHYETLFRSGGAGAILSTSDVGRKRILDTHQMSLLISAIKHSPRLHGFAVDVWTREQVGILIEREFGFSYSASHINRIIRDLGLTRFFTKAPPSRNSEHLHSHDVGV